MSKIHYAWRFACRHKYIITIFLIAFIVGVADDDSFLNRHPRRVRIGTLKQEIATYRQQFMEADTKIRELENNPKTVEKIARERYYMKHYDEDVFVFN